MDSLKVQQNSYKSSESWTDDLPVCKNTGIGFSTNQIYREDGHPQEEHPYEDYSSHFRFNDHFYWYGVFDGHEGKRAADFCSQRMIAEIYFFSKINEKKSDDEVRELLRQAFSTVEAGYMESLGDLLAERTSLQYEIPERLTTYEAYQKVPHIMTRINHINSNLASGTAAAVALICRNKLYIANVGTCRILLCQTDHNHVLKVLQLTVDHDLKNEDELLRLAQIGLQNVGSRLGNQENTRCLGNYSVKGGYKDFEDMATAVQEPIIAEPDIHGGIVLDESCRFLILMTAGLYRSVEEAIGAEQVNKYIAQCVVEQFREQATLTGVAQAVVDKVVGLHRDWFMSKSTPHPHKREDITLVLRNFNFPMPNALKSPTKVQFDAVVVANDVSDSTLTNQTVSTSSSSDRAEPEEELGEDQRIPAYVKFGDFWRNFEEAKKSGTLPECLLIDN